MGSFETEAASLDASKPDGPIGSVRLETDQSRRRRHRSVVVGLLIVGVLFPIVVDSSFRQRILVSMFLAATLTVGLLLSLAFTGQFNLSQGTFYGIGAYTTANLVTDYGVPFEVAILTAGVAAAVAGVLFGIASLRVRGDYFALLSLAFTIAAVQAMENLPAFTRGREGFSGIPEVTLFGVTIDTVTKSYYATLGLFVVCSFLVSRIARSFAGRAMLAVRHDEAAAAMQGISVMYTKLLALGLSAGVAGMAGAFLVAAVLFVSPANFDVLASLNPTIYVMIGGASIAGSALAAGGMVFVGEQFRTVAEYRLGILGLLVLVAVMIRGGVIPVGARRMRARLNRTQG